MKWVWRGITGLTLVVGWIFILSQNKFHIDAPVVVVMLAFLAVIVTVSNLWRVGAATVAEERPDEWGRPLGERGELDKEKRTLLKSIKDTEFDQAMGKLSKADAEQLIQMYRARAIEVIKELDRIDAASAGMETPRQKIERELAARVQIEEKKAKGKGKAKAKANSKTEAKASADAEADEAEAEGAAS